jgi:S1-C subfamily serine protease
MAASLTCPECATVIRSPSPSAGRQILCPLCGTVFRPRRQDRPDDDDRPITATLLTEPPARRPLTRRQRDEDEVPVKRGSGGLIVAVSLVLVGLLFVLCAGGGVVGLLVYRTFSSPDEAGAPVANAQGAPAVQPVANGPKAAEPAANVPPANAPANAPPGPPVPPIQPADPGAPAEPGATTIPVGVLRDLKAATVFIKVDAGNVGASGSGFLIRADGDTGFVMTNHHVVSLEPEGRGRFMFRNPGAPTITLVFWSGTPQEQSVRGEVVADDSEVDLAVLFFRGLRNPPRPIDPRQQPKLIETMPVFLFGFPFGEALAINKGNPAITVGKGSVSSLRTNERGEVARIQIDGDLNPGNSGGPVIDATGRLVGVARAKVLNTQIGWAIPAPLVTRLLTGKVPSFSVTTTKVENGTATVQVVGQVADPLRQIRGVSLSYVRGNQGGNVGTLPGAQSVALLVNGTRATGQVMLPVQDPANNVFTFQVAYVNGEGQTFLTAAQAVRVGVVAAAPAPNARAGAPPNPPPPAVPAQPRVLTNEELDRAIKDLAVVDGHTRRRAADLLAAAEPKERKAEVVKALQPLLNDSDLFLRGAVVKALGKWGGKDSVPLLLPLLKDGQALVRWAVFDVLTPLKDERCAEAVADRLPEPSDRLKAEQVLRGVGPPAEKAVLKHLENADWGLRVAVCRILKEIGTKESVSALEKAAQDQSLAHFANQALEAIKARR